MATLRRSLEVPVAPERVADYLSDLTTSTQWDPHTVACQRLDGGPVAVGARYAHTRAFGGYEVAIETQVVEFEPGSSICWEGGNEYATGSERLRFRPADGTGTEIEHTVEVTLQGVARFGNPMLAGVLSRIADDGTPVLRAALLALDDHAEGT